MKRFILPIFLLLIFLAAPVSAVHAQVFKLQLANPSQSIKTGDMVTVNILINTNGIATINGDALLKFDPTKVSIQSAQSGNFYTYFSNSPLGGSSTKYLVSSWEESIAHAKTSTMDVLFASFILKALSTGAATISMDCTTGTGADSNMNQASDAADIINCAALTPLGFNIGTATTGGATNTPAPNPTSKPNPTSGPVPTVPGGATVTPIRSSPSSTPVPGSPTNTPTPTRTPTPTSTPKPTATPRPTVTPRAVGAPGPVAGSAGVTVAFVGLGTLLTVIGILAIL